MDHMEDAHVEPTPEDLAQQEQDAAELAALQSRLAAAKAARAAAAQAAPAPTPLEDDLLGDTDALIAAAVASAAAAKEAAAQADGVDVASSAAAAQDTLVAAREQAGASAAKAVAATDTSTLVQGGEEEEGEGAASANAAWSERRRAEREMEVLQLLTEAVGGDGEKMALFKEASKVYRQGTVGPDKFMRALQRLLGAAAARRIIPVLADAMPDPARREALTEAFRAAERQAATRRAGGGVAVPAPAPAPLAQPAPAPAPSGPLFTVPSPARPPVTGGLTFDDPDTETAAAPAPPPAAGGARDLFGAEAVAAPPPPPPPEEGGRTLASAPLPAAVAFDPLSAPLPSVVPPPAPAPAPTGPDPFSAPIPQAMRPALAPAPQPAPATADAPPAAAGFPGPSGTQAAPAEAAAPAFVGAEGGGSSALTPAAAGPVEETPLSQDVVAVCRHDGGELTVTMYDAGTEVDEMGKNYTEYMLKCAWVREGVTVKWLVGRRYSEFDTLHGGLKPVLENHPQYSGRLMPPLPGKTLFGGLLQSVVEQRRRELTVYLRNLFEGFPIVLRTSQMDGFLALTARIGNTVNQFLARTAPASAASVPPPAAAQYPPGTVLDPFTGQPVGGQGGIATASAAPAGTVVSVPACAQFFLVMASPRAVTLDELHAQAQPLATHFAALLNRPPGSALPPSADPVLSAVRSAASTAEECLESSVAAGTDPDSWAGLGLAGPPGGTADAAAAEYVTAVLDLQDTLRRCRDEFASLSAAASLQHSR